MSYDPPRGGTPGRGPRPERRGRPPSDAERTQRIGPVGGDTEATVYVDAFSGDLAPARPASPRPAPQRPVPPRAGPRRPPEPPTEVIPRVAAATEDESVDDDGVSPAASDESPPPPPPDGPVRKTIRAFGELLITAGLVVLLFVVYEVYVTDLISAGKQEDATTALDQQWDSNTVEADPQRQAQYDLISGQAFAKMYIPVFGVDYKFSIVEGTTDPDLQIGPGHYVGTALPGQPGNFAVAGHRVGKGAPFNDLDLLSSCDAIVVETQTQWFVYRMLPTSKEAAGWAEGKGRSARCAGVTPLQGDYSRTVGQEIVTPHQGEVINTVPHVDGDPAGDKLPLMTLTTCHPRFSDKQRLIVHAVFVKGYDKKPGFIPDELKEQ
ncbi:hypothetical protein GCM10022243_28090 [Saccharothrix violaceirubra]|uniref:Sortase (Surface protein transpeptidase) n=1 Tax=Saccharothrix violaceirubra TaxID=413306 RepID=A0A7W7TAX9_9PSEU|nr:class E sortase [Saccharothrix violaceirubra]MBB4969267.1 sortase (surface protein transpeptidase) [Saccharothrix violaceirubra]